jgi:hypothetical protein
MNEFVNYRILSQGGILVENAFSEYTNDDVACIVINTKTKYPDVASYSYGVGCISLKTTEYSLNFDQKNRYGFTTIIFNDYTTNWRVFSILTGRYDVYVTLLRDENA